MHSSATWQPFCLSRRILIGKIHRPSLLSGIVFYGKHDKALCTHAHLIHNQLPYIPYKKITTLLHWPLFKSAFQSPLSIATLIKMLSTSNFSVCHIEVTYEIWHHYGDITVHFKWTKCVQHVSNCIWYGSHMSTFVIIHILHILISKCKLLLRLSYTHRKAFMEWSASAGLKHTIRLLQ